MSYFSGSRSRAILCRLTTTLYIHVLDDHIIAGLPSAALSAVGRGLRTVAMERRVQVVYRLDPDTVKVLRVLYGGRDFAPDDLPR